MVDSIAMQAHEAGNKVSSVALFKVLQQQQESTSKSEKKLPLPVPNAGQVDTKDPCASENQQQGGSVSDSIFGDHSPPHSRSQSPSGVLEVDYDQMDILEVASTSQSESATRSTVSFPSKI